MTSPHLMRGLSLIEMVVVVALFLAAMLALASMYGNFNSLYTFQQSFADTAGITGRVVNETENTVLPADSVLTSHTFASGTYASSASVLVTELPSIDSTGSVIVGKHDYAALYLNGSSVYRVLEADASSSRGSGTRKLGDTVTALSFTYDNADVTLAKTVTVSVTAQTTVKNAPVSSTLASAFRMRNHN